MEARERGVLVRQGRRLERPVPARVLRHRVDEPRIGEPRWGNGERCEEDKPDQGRDEHGVSEDEVVLSMPPVQEDRCRRDDRPVAVDVDPVGRRDERVVTQNGRLNRRSPCDPEAALKPCDRVSVREGGPGASFRRAADREVRDDEDCDDEDLPRHRLECPKRKCRSQRRHNASVPRAGGVGIRAGPQRSLWGSTHRESVGTGFTRTGRESRQGKRGTRVPRRDDTTASKGGRRRSATSLGAQLVTLPCEWSPRAPRSRPAVREAPAPPSERRAGSGTSSRFPNTRGGRETRRRLSP